MATLSVRNVQNKPVRSIELPDAVFAAPLHEQMIYEVVRQYRNTARAGTADSRNRKDVSGGGKKPWKQKHTGRARAGSTRSPLWRHGGTVHGPTPRSYAFALPRKVRRGALCSALSEKLREQKLIAIDSMDLGAPKTKELATLLAKGLGIPKSVLLVHHEAGRNLELAARNNPSVKLVRPLAVHVYDLLDYDTVVITEGALTQIADLMARTWKTAAKEGDAR
jgi:large subunit ribosomal protein L4